MSVPIAIPTIAGCPKCGRIKARLVPPITEPRLKKLDAIAGIKNRPLVFNTEINVFGINNNIIVSILTNMEQNYTMVQFHKISYLNTSDFGKNIQRYPFPTMMQQ